MQSSVFGFKWDSWNKVSHNKKDRHRMIFYLWDIKNHNKGITKEITKQQNSKICLQN